MNVGAYLFFNGRCEEALNFYAEKLGAEITVIMRNKEAPEPGMTPPEAGDKIMHANFKIGDTILMASDGMCDGSVNPGHHGYALSISVTDPAEGERLLAAVAEGGKVEMPFQKTFWAKGFGMAHDKFGVLWMLNCE